MNRVETPEQQGAQNVPQMKLGQYTLLEKVAQGGMAQVYKAKTVDPAGIERLVVIKRILPHISSQPEYVEMLIDEAKIAVHFTHGNIAQVYDLGRVGEDYFIVMEYVDGRTFSQINKALLERHQKMPLDILLYCFIELCHGLSYIHRKAGPSGKPLGVVHRDISPQNIILSYAGNVKVIDFGVARADFIESRTEHGVLKGKFAYMSPEQTKGDKIDNRSDIFSVGTLLWEMATGERLFKRSSNQDTIRAVQKAKYDLPSERRADIPAALDRVIRKALGRSARSRYQDAADMALDLEKLLFSINPEFRPISAAKFLYDLFGPEQDEASLPPPFFVKASSEEERSKSRASALSVSAVARQASRTKAAPNRPDEEPTIREVIADEVTPIVKMPRFRRFRTQGWFVSLSVIFLFVLGSVYAFYVHQLNKRAYLSFTGAEEGMTLYINGDEKHLQGVKLTVSSSTPYQIRITKEGYKDFIRQLELGPREETKINIKLEKTIPPLGDLTIETSPSGANVFIDGKPWGQTTPVTIKNLNNAQKYRVRIMLPNYVPIEQNIDILGGKVIHLSKTLETDYAELKFESVPEGAEVFIDEASMGVTPLSLPSITPGVERKIRISLSGYEDVLQSVTLQPGENREIKTELKSAQPDDVKLKSTTEPKPTPAETP